MNEPDKFEGRFERFEELGVSGGLIQAHMLNWDGDVSNRKQAKKWWRDRKKYIHDWRLYEVWAEENSEDVAMFVAALDTSVKLVSKTLRKLAKYPESG